MKKIEKYALASLIGAIFFSLVRVNVYVGTLILAVSFIIFIMNKRDVKYLFVAIPIFIGSLLTFDKEINTGELYKFKINVDKKIEIKNINHKFVKNKYYLEDKFLENRIGNFEVIIKVEKVEKFNSINYINGEIVSIKESYFNRYRTSIRKIIENTGYSYEVEAFVKAIVLGERGELSQELEENYRKIGASHILSISGLHISIIVLMFIGIFHFFSFSYRMKYTLTLIILTFYIGILGNNPAILRSYIMGVIYLLSKIFYEKSDLKKSFCISLILLIFINPNVILDLSFIMSYGALFGIIYIYDKFKKDNVYYNAFALSLIVQMVLTPVTIYYFKTMAVYSFIFNIFIVVWGDFLINFIFFGVFLESIKAGFLLKGIIEFFYEVLDVFVKTMSKFLMVSLELEREIPVYFFVGMIILIFLWLWDIKYMVYGLMICLLFYNLLPYENQKGKNYYYFPKEKVLVILANEEKGMKKYLSKAKVIVGGNKNKKNYKDKEFYEVKRGEVLNIGKIEVSYGEKIECTYK